MVSVDFWEVDPYHYLYSKLQYLYVFHQKKSRCNALQLELIYKLSSFVIEKFADYHKNHNFFLYFGNYTRNTELTLSI